MLHSRKQRTINACKLNVDYVLGMRAEYGA